MEIARSLDIVAIKGPVIFEVSTSIYKAIYLTWYMRVIESLLFNLVNTHVRACFDCKSFLLIVTGLDAELHAVREYNFLAQHVHQL